MAASLTCTRLQCGFLTTEGTGVQVLINMVSAFTKRLKLQSPEISFTLSGSTGPVCHSVCTQEMKTTSVIFTEIIEHKDYLKDSEELKGQTGNIKIS